MVEREDPAPHFDVTAAEATVVDGDFDVEDQHNWIYFSLSLPAGSHEVVAKSDSGGALRESFRVPRNTTRYAIIEHWTADDSEPDDAPVDLTWQFLRQAPAFG